MITGAVAVLVVSDMPASIAYYRDILGFKAELEFGTPPTYACLCRDEAGIHVVAATHAKRLPGQGGVALFVDDVDALYAELSGRRASIPEPPQDRPYGMRDFNVIDPDGNLLTFGMTKSQL